jgi:acyl transferase domain-containing protein
MALPTVFMFSGQGSHYYQMGRELFEQEPLFRKELLELDALHQELAGLSVVAEVYDPRRGKSELFDRTPLTHPAIFMVEIALARTLIARGLTPDFVLGASMGTFAAATIAGCLPADQALRAVIEQARLLDALPRGGMLAVADGAGRLGGNRHLHDRCEVAAVNFESHFVLSGADEDLRAVEERLQRDAISFQRLAVSQAFHSRGIDAAEQPFRQFARTLSLAPARIPIVCCATAATIDLTDPEHFWTVIRQPIRLPETIRALTARGPIRFLDAGPSGTLATLVKYNLPAGSPSQTLPILTPYGTDLRNLGRVT